MAELPVVKYVGKIREIKIGKPGTELTLGGQTAYSFHLFEGLQPNPPKLGLQVLDIAPQEWAPAAFEPFKDVCGDPVAWARKCVEEYGADFICLWLFGTDPNGNDLPPEHAAEVAKKVADAINVPLIVWGVSSDDKNRETLRAVCESCQGLNLAIGPVTEHTYRQIGASAIAYKHAIVANSPIDINLAKQLNILLENLGMPSDRIIMDCTTSGVGYGMEYCYSIMERVRQAALCQNDEKLQYPLFNNIAEEVWKVREAKMPQEDDPKLGDATIRGINLECVTAISVLNAGSDILVLRHPETLKHVRSYVNQMMELTDLESMDIDLALTVVEPAAAKPAPKPEAPPKPAATPKPAPKPVAPPKPAAEAPKTRPAEKPVQPPLAKPAATPPVQKAPSVAPPPPAQKVPLAAMSPTIREAPAVSIGKLELIAEPKPLERAPKEEGVAALVGPARVPDDKISRLRIALSLWRSLQALEKKVDDARSAGVSLEESALSPDEITAYRDMQLLGRALSVMDSRITEAESVGKAVDELDYSEADLNTLRSGFAVMRNRLPVKPLDDMFLAKIRETAKSRAEIERLQIALSVWRTIQGLERKISTAQEEGISVEELEFSEAEIVSWREVQSLGAALTIVESKLSEAEAKGKEIHEIDFSEAEIRALRSVFAILKEKQPTLAPEKRATLASPQPVEEDNVEPTVPARIEKTAVEQVTEPEERYVAEIDLPDEDVEILKNMLSIFRGAKQVILGIKNLLTGKVA